MATSVQFGNNRTLHVLCENVKSGSQPRGTPLEDPVSHVRDALADPLDFPPIRDAVLPDDRVVVALEENLACAAELVAGVVGSLLGIGCPPERISILRTNEDRAISNQRLTRLVDRSARDRIVVTEHDPADRQSLAYLGASNSDQPILINRQLCDADVVIPIGMLHADDHVRGLGVHHGWFPSFSDAETQHRFCKSQSSLSSKKLAKRQVDCQEAAWMLGILFTVQLIPAGNDQALHILAGSPDVVWQRGIELTEQAWQCDTEQVASLVVAAIGGGPEQQTWQNVARTVHTAQRMVEDDGAIVICSQLRSRPGPALRRLAGAEDFESADRAIRKKPTKDALAAIRLNRALQQSRIYLLSELPENDVEDLGMAYVSDASQIEKLSGRHPTCLVLENAQYIAMTADHTANT